MSKAPAIQIYIEDFLGGTRFFSNAQTGLYIRLLLEQADKGFVGQEVIENLHVYGKDAQAIWPSIASKFVQCEDGKYRNDRMSQVIEGREAFRLKQSEKGKLSAEARLSRGKTKNKPRFNRGSTVVEPLGDGDGDIVVQEREEPSSAESKVEVIPIGMSAEMWSALKRWEQYRVESKKRLTPSGKEALIKKCAAIGDQRAIAAIDHSIAQGWTGMYEAKETTTNGQSSEQQRAANYERILAERYPNG